MFTDEDRKRALEALAANGGRVTKTLRELGLPLDRFGHESFIPTAQLVGNEVEYMLDDQRAAPGALDNILAAPFHDLLLPRMDGPLSFHRIIRLYCFPNLNFCPNSVFLSQDGIRLLHFSELE